MLRQRYPPPVRTFRGGDPQCAACPVKGALGDPVDLPGLLLHFRGPAWAIGERRLEVVLRAGFLVLFLTAVPGAQDVPDGAVGFAVEHELANPGITLRGRDNG